jgi:hypothetical protein
MKQIPFPRPPLPLQAFLGQMQLTAATGWRMRRNGELQTINIHGRVYVMAEHVDEYNRRAAAGEFAKHHVTPTSPAPARKRAA